MTVARVALLGAGNRAHDHLTTISRLGTVCQLVDVCDADAARGGVHVASETPVAMTLPLPTR